MAAVLTGTPVAVAWAAGINPAGQSITIPADATAVYMVWSFAVGANGHGLASATLNGASPNQTYEIAGTSSYDVATGVAVWYSPSTGSQTLDPAWDIAPEEGPSTIVFFTKDGNLTTWADVDAAHATGTTAVTVTLTTTSGDLVVKFDQRYNGNTAGSPALSSGWTNGQTQTANVESSRLSYISATTTTQVCDSENEDYSSIVAIAIGPSAGGGGGGTQPPRSMNQYRLRRA
jgi:hypothetical protein